ncbi:hypothetical protein [Paenibacillus sp. P36]|uniref:hypothetical protein n=1 Tax=Paenibacillus sp. P36 TaxID=3342538 RepID=UPI0038B38579
MTQKSEHESKEATNDLSQNTAIDGFHTTDEGKSMNDRIKAETTPETCRASLDGN